MELFKVIHSTKSGLVAWGREVPALGGMDDRGSPGRGTEDVGKIIHTQK